MRVDGDARFGPWVGVVRVVGTSSVGPRVRGDGLFIGVGSMGAVGTVSTVGTVGSVTSVGNIKSRVGPGSGSGNGVVGVVGAV